MRPIGIDLFAGAGGMSLGFERAGFEVVAAVEIDPIHAATHKFNFPNCAVLARSVVGLSAKEIRLAAGIGNRKVDIVFGGAPCQGFSMIGHRALHDPRNHLVSEFVRLVTELDASYFVFENVKGLTVGRHKEFLEEIVGAFEAQGYAVRLPWRVLNAIDYGTPQSRERLFLLGAKSDLKLPVYPGPSTGGAGAKSVTGLPIGPTCADALGDLPDADRFEELITGDAVRTAYFKRPSSYAAGLRCLTNDAWALGTPRVWDPMLLTSSMRTGHSEISRRRFAETKGGSIEPISRFFKLPRDGVSNTLRAGTDAARGAFTSPRPIHYVFDRCVTVREMARLHGFPDWFRFHETKWHGARQVGNSVPPPLAQAVATAVMAAADRKLQPVEAAIELGDPALLRIGMKDAASMFGTAVPIGRRDRKSGAKKRSQAETEAARISARPAAYG
jgi:DNA (cytosine-5)-methyltransferase 1